MFTWIFLLCFVLGTVEPIPQAMKTLEVTSGEESLDPEILLEGLELDPVCKECVDAITLAKDVIGDTSTPVQVMKDKLVDSVYFLCTAASKDYPEDLTTEDCEDLRQNFQSVGARAFLSVVGTFPAEYICGRYAGAHNPLTLHACSGLHENSASFFQSLVESYNDPYDGYPECFPGDAVVTTSTGRPKLMKDVSYGEKILSLTAEGNLISDTVLFLHHRFEDQTQTRTYVALQTASGHLLEVSPNHLVYLNGCCSTSQLQPAYNAQVSDTLLVFVNGTGMQSPIVSVGLTEKAGFLNVGMQNGNRIVVNDIAATYFTEEHRPLGSYIEYMYYFMGHGMNMFPLEQVEYFVLPVQEFLETIYLPSSLAYTTIHKQCPFWLKPITSALWAWVRAAISISTTVIVALILIAQNPSFWIILSIAPLTYLSIVLPNV